jgi:hypothetical protein
LGFDSFIAAGLGSADLFAAGFASAAGLESLLDYDFASDLVYLLIKPPPEPLAVYAIPFYVYIF